MLTISTFIFSGCSIASEKKLESVACDVFSVTQDGYADIRMKGLILSNCDAGSLGLNIHQTLSNYLVRVNSDDLKSISNQFLATASEFNAAPIKRCLGSVKVSIENEGKVFTGSGEHSIRLINDLKKLLADKNYAVDALDSQIGSLEDVTKSKEAKTCESWSIEEYKKVFAKVE